VAETRVREIRTPLLATAGTLDPHPDSQQNRTNGRKTNGDSFAEFRSQRETDACGCGGYLCQIVSRR
jgi:hypothetical protein